MSWVAQSLREVNRTLDAKPLRTAEELRHYYRGESALERLRGRDAAKELAVALDREPNDEVFKAFILGRSGVGKSTEITRLITMTGARYQPLRIDLRNEIDPTQFAAYDVILLICILLAEETKEVTGSPPSPYSMSRLLTWYAEGEEKTTAEIKSGMEAAAGADVKDTWWQKVLAAFVTLKGGIAVARTRTSTEVAYKLKRIQPLVEIANQIVWECNAALQKETGKEWLILAEDADKPGFDRAKLKELFVVHGNVLFSSFRANLVFNLPLALTYGESASILPPLPRFVIFDAPVFESDKTPNEETLAVMSEVVYARVEPDLFEPDQVARLIIASGANLRDLFAMIRAAALHARVRGESKISALDVNRVIADWRVQFQARLGSSVFDTERLSPDDKTGRLVQLYHAEDTGAEPSDDLLGALVDVNLVQEFNGRHWYGLHPLAVDVLARMKKLNDPQGGTR